MKTLLPASLLLFAFASFARAVAADAPPATATVAAPSLETGPRPFVKLPLGNPRGIAVDGAGNLCVIDVDSGSMYRITPGGEVSDLRGPRWQGIVSPLALIAFPDGGFFIADAEGDKLYRTDVDGSVLEMQNPTGDARFQSPTGVAANAAGDIFVANNLAHTILSIAPEGFPAVFAGKADEVGSADGPAAEARFHTPLGLATDAAGNLYVADKGNSSIRKITPAGIVSTLAGKAGESGSADGPGASARFAAPRAVAADAAGNVYVADTENNCIRKITTDGVVSTLAGQAGQAGKADGPGAAARFNNPRGIAVDARGHVYVADGGNGAIRQISPEGLVTTIAAATPPDTEPAVSGLPPIVPPRVGESERVDYSRAQTFDGWDADPAYWTVKDGVFAAKGDTVPTSFLLTQKLYSDFRLTLWSQVPVSENHAGVAFWGERRVSARNQFGYKGPLVIFPGLSIWDYRTNKNVPVDPVGKALAREVAKQHDWILVEILAQGNRVRVAYNGRQVLDWREPDPSLIKTGPIALQLHGHAKPTEVIYKDVIIETFPKEDRLLTLKE